MTNPTTPLPVQEPAGAVDQTVPMKNGYSLFRSKGAFQYWKLMLDGEEIRQLTTFEAEFVEAALASLQPITQARSEAAWWTFKSITGGQVFYEGPTRPEGAPERAEPLYAAPQEAVACRDSHEASLKYVEGWEAAKADSAAKEAVERQPLTGWQPIETAPKSTTMIMLFGDGPAIRQCAMVGGWDHLDDQWTLAPSSVSFCPTHWQPLPEPPGIGPATQEKP